MEPGEGDVRLRDSKFISCDPDHIATFNYISNEKLRSFDLLTP